MYSGDMKKKIKELEEANDHLEQQNVEFRQAIEQVLSQREDDLCWMDVYVMLGRLVGQEITPAKLAVLPVDKMMEKCERYCKSLKGGEPYQRDHSTIRIRQLEAETRILRAVVAKQRAKLRNFPLTIGCP
jgi:hypothetical protein